MLGDDRLIQSSADSKCDRMQVELEQSGDAAKMLDDIGR
jgi:hypothetical protein